MTIIAAADGSALGNPGPAGWAWYVDEDRWRAGGWDHGTNNMGELMAVLDLLRSTEPYKDEPLLVLCDSQYVINSVTKWRHGWKKRGWKKADGKPVLNVDLMKELDAALAGRQVDFEWVKGHAGHHLNEAADDRARAAATAHQKGRRPDAGPGYAPDGEGASSGASVPDAAGSRSAAGAPAAGAGSVDEDVAAASQGVVELDAGVSASDPISLALTLEAEAMDAAERGDAETLRFLLSPSFRGVVAGARLVDRDTLAAAEADRAAVDGVERLAEEALTQDLVQLAYRQFRGDEGAVITSWWRREGTRWRCVFRQETVAS